MKIAVNRSYGAFILHEEQTEMLKPFVNEDFIFEVDYKHELRSNDKLIEVIEATQDTNSIKVIEIPDNATDYIINEHDGFETVYYVVDGKIKRA